MMDLNLKLSRVVKKKIEKSLRILTKSQNLIKKNSKIKFNKSIKRKNLWNNYNCKTNHKISLINWMNKN